MVDFLYEGPNPLKTNIRELLFVSAGLDFGLYTVF